MTRHAARAERDGPARSSDERQNSKAGSYSENSHMALYDGRFYHDLGVWEIERSRLGADAVDVIGVKMAD